MDYDGIAQQYAQHRRHNAAVLRRLVSGGRVEPGARVIEVGCGTGNYIVELRRSMAAACYGVDPSAGMLAIARGRSKDVSLVLAAGEALPSAPGRFGLVFLVDVVHHLRDLSGAIREAFHVLQRGGTICVVTEDEETIEGRLHSKYFPEGMEIEVVRYPTIDEIESAMSRAGFGAMAIDRTASPYRVTSAKAYREKAFSELHLISDAAHRQGLALLERDLEEGPIDAVERRVLVWGTK